MRLESVSKTFSQRPDDEAPDEMILNTITIETDDAGAGPYLVIRTERWAMDDAAEIDALAAEMKRILAEVEGEQKEEQP